jgi:hypothetical protein
MGNSLIQQTGMGTYHGSNEEILTQPKCCAVEHIHEEFTIDVRQNNQFNIETLIIEKSSSGHMIL